MTESERAYVPPEDRAILQCFDELSAHHDVRTRLVYRSHGRESRA